MFQRFGAEFVATFALVFIGAGAICIDALSGGKVGLVGIAFAHGLAIVVMVYATVHISGAHINPAVSFGMWLTRRLSTGLTAGYIVSQLLGAVAAACLLKKLFPQFVSATPFLGNPALSLTIDALGTGYAIGIEAILTFFLVFVIFAVAVDTRGLKAAVGLSIGLTITADILMGGMLTGAAMNPARAFATALISGQMSQQVVYWVGPLLGGGVAALLYDRFFLNR